MRFPIRLLPNTPRINFVRARFFGLALSFIAIAITIFMLQTRGLNLGIDFAGGILLEIRTEQPAELSKLRELLNDKQIGDASLQQVGNDNDVMIRIQPKTGISQAELVEVVKSKLSAEYGAPVKFLRVDYVGPQVGDEMLSNSLIALGLGLLAIMLYLWFRFEWQFGTGGILAMLHDAILTIGFYAITGLEFNLTSVAAILTIIGYSINDSVVIYDRIRENMRKYKKRSLADLINLSVNETLSRTILTGGTVLLALAAFIFYGGEVLYGFSLAMFVGTIIGTYSSIFVSATILLWIRPRRDDSSAT